MLFATVAASGQVAEGTIGIRLVDVPAERADDPRAQLYVVDHVAPGMSFSRRLEVVNATSESVTVELYPTEAEISEGGFRFPEGRSENDLASWVSLERSELTILAGEKAQTEFSIDVPPDATAGERYAVVWAEPPAGQAGNVRVVNRVGVRIYLSVGFGSEPATDFGLGPLIARRSASGVPILESAVTNTGERALDVQGELRLSDGPGGLSAGPMDSDGALTLGPGDTEPISIELDPQLPAGPWLATLVVRSGLLAKAVEATIVFPEDAGESAKPVDATEVPLHQDRGVLIPLAFGLLILALFLVFLVWWLKRRRDDEEEEADEGAGRGHATAVAED